MRPLFPFAAALLLIVSSPLRAQTAPAKPTAPKAAPAVPAKPEETPKIPGIELARAGGGFIGVQTQGVTLKVTFYDAEKKKTAADAVRIAARWSDNRARNTVLLPSGPETLVSPPVISRPFNYFIFLVLVGVDDKPIETFRLRLNGSDL